MHSGFQCSLYRPAVSMPAGGQNIQQGARALAWSSESCTHDSLFSLHSTEMGWQREVIPEESCVAQSGLQEGTGAVALIRQCCHFPRL